MKKNGKKKCLELPIADVLCEQLVENRFVDIREEAGDIQLDNIGRGEVSERRTQKMLSGGNGLVRATFGNAGVGMGDKSRDIVGFDEFLDDPLVNDTVMNRKG